MYYGTYQLASFAYIDSTGKFVLPFTNKKEGCQNLSEEELKQKNLRHLLPFSRLSTSVIKQNQRKEVFQTEHKINWIPAEYRKVIKDKTKLARDQIVAQITKIVLGEKVPVFVEQGIKQRGKHLSNKDDFDKKTLMKARLIASLTQQKLLPFVNQSYILSEQHFDDNEKSFDNSNIEKLNQLCKNVYGAKL